jgi:GTP-binding protein
VEKVSAATPRIGDYPFTTLAPTLGIVRVDAERTFVIADLPGLIPGAATGKGLGHQFLRHTERTRLLVHLLDLDPLTGRDPLDDLRVINEELEAYSAELAARPQIVVANKADLWAAEEDGGPLPRIEAYCAERGLPFYAVSAATGRGVAELVRGIAHRLEGAGWMQAAS